MSPSRQRRDFFNARWGYHGKIEFELAQYRCSAFESPKPCFPHEECKAILRRAEGLAPIKAMIGHKFQ